MTIKIQKIEYDFDYFEAVELPNETGYFYFAPGLTSTDEPVRIGPYSCKETCEQDADEHAMRM